MNEPLDQPEITTGMKTSRVWLPSGKRFEFSVEEGYTMEDMEFVLKMLDLFKTAIVPKESKRSKELGKA